MPVVGDVSVLLLLLERKLSRQVCSCSVDLKQDDIVGHAPKLLTFLSKRTAVTIS